MTDIIDLFGDPEPDYDNEPLADAAQGADWHMRLWRRLRRQRDELAAEFDHAIGRLMERKADVLGPIEKKMKWHEDGLERFARADNARSKRATHHLPSGGATKITRAPARLKYDDEGVLLAWLEAEHPELVKEKVERKPDLSGLKKIVQWREMEPGSMTEAVTVDGQVVPGVTVVFPAKRFSIVEEDE